MPAEVSEVAILGNYDLRIKTYLLSIMQILFILQLSENIKLFYDPTLSRFECKISSSASAPSPSEHKPIFRLQQISKHYTIAIIDGSVTEKAAVGVVHPSFVPILAIPLNNPCIR